MKRLPRLGSAPDAPFPPLACALREPDGLLATGGDLSAPRLLKAYAQGIFPWFSPGEAILWWSPDPRVVFDLAGFELPRRFRRGLRSSAWTVSADTQFAQVMRHCALIPRAGQDGGSWIGAEMLEAYVELHRLGHAHSVEVHEGGHLVGGIYGVAIGRMFFGESMFSARPGGSKVALGALARVLQGWGWPLLDAQVGNEHLFGLGARALPRADFADRVAGLVAQEGRIGPWSAAFEGLCAADLALPARPGF